MNTETKMKTAGQTLAPTPWHNRGNSIHDANGDVVCILPIAEELENTHKVARRIVAAVNTEPTS